MFYHNISIVSYMCNIKFLKKVRKELKITKNIKFFPQ